VVKKQNFISLLWLLWDVTRKRFFFSHLCQIATVGCLEKGGDLNDIGNGIKMKKSDEKDFGMIIGLLTKK